MKTLKSPFQCKLSRSRQNINRQTRRSSYMIEIIFTIAAILLLIKAVSLAFKLTWGTIKIISSILLILAIPIFILCLIFAGGLALLFPVIVIAGVIGLIKAFT